MPPSRARALGAVLLLAAAAALACDRAEKAPPAPPPPGSAVEPEAARAEPTPDNLEEVSLRVLGMT